MRTALLLSFVLGACATGGPRARAEAVFRCVHQGADDLAAIVEEVLPGPHGWTVIDGRLPLTIVPTDGAVQMTGEPALVAEALQLLVRLDVVDGR